MHSTRTRLRLSVLCGLLWLVGAGASAFASEPRWIEVRSPNLTVLTDTDEKKGKDVALHFEQMRAVFGTLFAKAKVQSGQPLYIVAFRNSKEMRHEAPLWHGKPVEMTGFFQAGQGASYIVIDLSTEDRWSTVFHEFAHFLLNANSMQAPTWFDEGFAEYYSTVKVEKDTAVVGNIPAASPDILSQMRWLPILELFSTRPDSRDYNEGDRRTVFYAESWLAVHYFLHDPVRNKQLQQYMALAQHNVPVAEAFQRSFGVEPKVLDKELENYFHNGKTAIYSFKLPPGLGQLQFASKPVDELDARARLDDMRLQSQDHFEEAMQDFEAILKQRPTQPLALRGLGYAWLRKGDEQKAGEYFDRAAAQDSSDPQVLYLAAVLASQMGAQKNPELLKKMSAALEKAVSLDANFADAYGWLGLAYVWQNNYVAGIPAMQKAVDLSPRNEQWAFNLATAFVNQQRLDEAIPLLERLKNSSEPNLAANASNLLANIREYQTAAQLRNAQQSAQWVATDDSAAPSGAAAAGSPPASGNSHANILQFFSGTVTQVACAAPRQATLTVAIASGAITVETPDYSQVTYAGPGKFSCLLKGQMVKGLYQPKDGKRVLIELEIE